MANKLKLVAFLILFLLTFFAGGWFFRQLPNMRAPQGEVEEMYQEDGASLGIFDNIPQEDMAAAEAVAAEALGLDAQALNELDKEQALEEENQVDQINFSDIAQIIPKDQQEKQFSSEEYLPGNSNLRLVKKKAPVDIRLSGEEVVAIGPQESTSANEQEDSNISLIAAPVKIFLIKNTDEYKVFKTRARGGYPEVDFNKQMLVVLESDSNLPDNIFEIVSAEVKDGQLVIAYRVNVFGLDKKTNTHTAIAVEKTELPVELKQVL